MITRRARWVLLLLTSAAVPAAPSVAQEFHEDQYGVWRYVEPPPVDRRYIVVPDGFYGPQPRVIWRRVEPLRPNPEPPGMRLRGVVPLYDEPPLYVDPPPRYDARPRSPEEDPWVLRQRRLEAARGDFPEEYDTRTVPPVARMPLDELQSRDNLALAPDQDDWAIREPGDGYEGDWAIRTPGPDYDLPDEMREAPRGDPVLASGLARYAAAKRAAIGEADPAKRMQAVREANAWLVSLSRGPASTDAIRAIDTLLGIEPITKDSVQLPGAGTEVKEPGREPRQEDFDAARLIAGYADQRARGRGQNEARPLLKSAPEDLSWEVLAALDGFLGVEDRTVVNR